MDAEVNQLLSAGTVVFVTEPVEVGTTFCAVEAEEAWFYTFPIAGSQREVATDPDEVCSIETEV
jgi:hypothetical protein